MTACLKRTRSICSVRRQSRRLSEMRSRGVAAQRTPLGLQVQFEAWLRPASRPVRAPYRTRGELPCRRAATRATRATLAAPKMGRALLRSFKRGPTLQPRIVGALAPPR